MATHEAAVSTSFANLSLRSKLMLLMALFCLFLLSSAAVTIVSIGLYLDATLVRIASLGDVDAALENLLADVEDGLQEAVGRAATASPFDASTRARITRTAFDLDALGADGGGQRLGRALLSARDEIESRYQEWLASGGPEAGPAGAGAFLTSLQAEFRRSVADVRGRLHRQNLGLADIVDRVQLRVLALLAGNVVLAVLLLAFGASRMHRWLTVPIQDLRAASEHFAAGDLRHRAPVRGMDELGRLAEQTNRMAESLERSYKLLLERERLAAIGEFSSAVAHGVRGPLVGMASSAELILDHGQMDPESRRRLGSLLDETRRLHERIAALLDFARTRQLSPVPLPLDEWVQDAVQQLGARFEAGRVQVDVRAADPPQAAVCADRQLLVNALVEVLTNAAEQNGSPARIEVWASLGPQSANVTVRDHGPGFSDDTLARGPRLFSTTRPGGAGVGLASARKALELHAGTLTLANHPEGGAVVTLSVPAAGNAATATARI